MLKTITLVAAALFISSISTVSASAKVVKVDIECQTSIEFEVAPNVDSDGRVLSTLDPIVVGTSCISEPYDRYVLVDIPGAPSFRSIDSAKRLIEHLVNLSHSASAAETN